MNTPQTPAQRLATDLAVVAVHLAAHPDLPKVHITPARSGPISLQCAGYSTEGWTSAEQQTAAWAETLPGATIVADCWTAVPNATTHSAGLRVTIKVRAKLDGTPIEIWDLSAVPEQFDVEPGHEHELTLDELRALVPAEVTA